MENSVYLLGYRLELRGSDVCYQKNKCFIRRPILQPTKFSNFRHGGSIPALPMYIYGVYRDNFTSPCHNLRHQMELSGQLYSPVSKWDLMHLPVTFLHCKNIGWLTYRCYFFWVIWGHRRSVMGYSVQSKTIRTDSSIFKSLQRIYKSTVGNVGK